MDNLSQVCSNHPDKYMLSSLRLLVLHSSQQKTKHRKCSLVPLSPPCPRQREHQGHPLYPWFPLSPLRPPPPKVLDKSSEIYVPQVRLTCFCEISIKAIKSFKAIIALFMFTSLGFVCSGAIGARIHSMYNRIGYICLENNPDLRAG